MMNENSPIWARLSPARTELRSPLPDRNAPSDTPSTLPTITSAVNTSTGTQYSSTRYGLICSPTAIKKIAANRSLSGLMRCSTRGPSPDSDTSIPAMNAPSAAE